MWQVSVNGQVLGSFTREQLAPLVASGQVGQNAYVAGGQFINWTPITQVPELAGLFGAAAMAGTAPAPMAGAGMAGAAPAAMAGAGMAGAAPAGMSGPTGGYGALKSHEEMERERNLQAVLDAGNTVEEHSGNWLMERLAGLKAMGLGVLLIIANFATIYLADSYYPVVVVFAMGSFGYGGWVLVFGDEYDDKTMKLIMWKRAGMWSCAGAGAIFGLAVAAFLGGLY